jgi:hypothetical protein
MWNVNEALDFYIGQPLNGFFVVASIFNICAPGRLFAGMGAFDSFGRSLNAQFEKRSPWPCLQFKAWHGPSPFCAVGLQQSEMGGIFNLNP